jgi:hypothetical protein
MGRHLRTWILCAAALAACGGKRDGSAEVSPPAATVMASAAAETEEASPRQKQLDAASARLAAGRNAFDARDYPMAMVQAQRGLDALGKDYASPQVIDDTDLKIALAKERADHGSPQDGATIMLRMLAERIEMARQHWQLGP